MKRRYRVVVDKEEGEWHEEDGRAMIHTLDEMEKYSFNIDCQWTCYVDVCRRMWWMCYDEDVGGMSMVLCT